MVSPTTITTLPTECLSEIASYLDLPPLFHLRLTSRRFHALVDYHACHLIRTDILHLDEALQSLDGNAPRAGIPLYKLLADRQRITHEVAARLPEEDQHPDLIPSLYVLWRVVLRHHAERRIFCDHPGTSMAYVLSSLPTADLPRVARAADVLERVLKQRLVQWKEELCSRSGIPKKSIVPFLWYIRYVVSCGMENVHGVLMCSDRDVLLTGWLCKGKVNEEGRKPLYRSWRSAAGQEMARRDKRRGEEAIVQITEERCRARDGEKRRWRHWREK